MTAECAIFFAAPCELRVFFYLGNYQGSNRFKPCPGNQDRYIATTEEFLSPAISISALKKSRVIIRIESDGVAP
jgi:hypothetical protein